MSTPRHIRVYGWLLATVASAFDTFIPYITKDTELKELRDHAWQGELATGKKDGVLISFDPKAQVLTFTCLDEEQAMRIAEEISGMRKGRIVSIAVPQKISGMVDGEVPIPAHDGVLKNVAA
ncbi:MAG TPA: hypothetical protein VFT82_02510 [Candidatus Paceibacterota bacterium]|nr:hypothetical protein [Candidatus Paceibacterota bacterium]